MISLIRMMMELPIDLLVSSAEGFLKGMREIQKSFEIDWGATGIGGAEPNPGLPDGGGDYPETTVIRRGRPDPAPRTGPREPPPARTLPQQDPAMTKAEIPSEGRP